MPQVIRLLLFFWLLIYPFTVVVAWNAQGHRVVGYIAQANLTEETERQVMQLLEYSALLPEGATFVDASVWADQIRGQGVHLFNHWHYIGQPYVEGDVRYYPANPVNIVNAINESVNVLSNHSLPEQLRGFYLLMLLHMVGDIHQPLHCVSLFSRDFVYGDRGGNRYSISCTKANNLHRLWDIGLGMLVDEQSAQVLAQQFQETYPMETFAGAQIILTPDAWAQACYQLALDYAYKVELQEVPTPSYLQQGQMVSAQQLTLAGYRLANLLNQINL